MKKNYLRNLCKGAVLLALLGIGGGLPAMTWAQTEQADSVLLSKDMTFSTDQDLKKLVVTGTDTTAHITFNANATIDLIEIQEGASACFHFDKEQEHTFRFTRVVNNGSLLFGEVYDDELSPETRLIAANVENYGKFEDQSGAIQKVKGPGSLSLDKVWGATSATVPTFSINYEGTHGEEVLAAATRIQIWDKEKSAWIDEEQASTKAPANAAPGTKAASDGFDFSGSLSGKNKAGTYRVVFDADDLSDKLCTILRSRAITFETGEGDKLANQVFDAILLTSSSPDTRRKVEFTNMQAAENIPHVAVAVPKNSAIELHLTGSNSQLDTLEIGGNLKLTNDGKAQLTNTTIVNNGTFVDSTATVNKVYGQAGIWVESMQSEPSSEATDGTEIHHVSTVFHLASIYELTKEISIETYKEGQWVAYKETTNQEAATKASLRSNDDSAWQNHSAKLDFEAAEGGTYRIKYYVQNKKNGASTTLYSKSFVFASSAEQAITDEHTAIGSNDAETLLPSLAITAQGTTDKPAEATLTNVSVSENEAGAPSVRVDKLANVNLTLEGDNNLGAIEVEQGGAITLKQEDGGTLTVSSVRNGGMFTDETGTISEVKDLNNQTMIAFSDTVATQVGNSVNISWQVYYNTLDGEYFVTANDALQKWNEETNAWEEYPKPQTKSNSEVESTDKSGVMTLMISTSEPGLYRKKVTSTSIENESIGATLYFLFEIEAIDPTIIDKDQTVEGEHEYLQIGPKENTLLNVMLKDVTVAQHGDIASTVVVKDQKVTITLEGNNDLGRFHVAEGATVILKPGANFKDLTAEVSNGGHFTDETGTIKTVKDLTGHTMVHIKQFIEPIESLYGISTIVVTYDAWEGYLADENISLEKWNGTAWSAIKENIEATPATKAADESEDLSESTYTATVTDPGKYRFKILSEAFLTAGGAGNPDHSATLYQYFTVAEPEPTYYSITLPEVEGVTTTPAAGTYWEEEGNSFSFSLSLKPGYEASEPIVKTNGKLLQSGNAGQYVIGSIYEDITITIEGVDNPTGNAEVESAGIKVWAADGALRLSIPTTKPVWIYSFSGTLIRSLGEVAGDHTIALPAGSYIIVVGETTYKLAL